ncbi:MAG: PEP-CTERM system histidine kinase PrsK [Gammaproteobacteria bacterium]
MTLDLGLVGYLIATTAYTALLVVLLIGWRKGGFHGVLLIGATLLSAVWAGIVAWQGAHEIVVPKLVLAVESLRDAAWVAFLWRVLLRVGDDSMAVPKGVNVVVAAAAVLALAMIGLLVAPELLISFDTTRLVLVCKLGLALCALILTEHLYRYTVPHRRWAIKHLCIALAGIYGFEFYKYAEALLFHDVQMVLLDARGYINAVVVPLVAVSASRNPRWKLEVFVSRQVVFHSGVLIVAGIYLMAVATAGYYLRQFGGDWSRIMQVVLVFTAVILLIVVIASGDVRARLKVFINKHFFHYRFDHREEWLRITNTLIGDDMPTEDLPQRSLRAIADIVGSNGGLLLLRRADNRYDTAARWNVGDTLRLSKKDEEELIRFFTDTGWIVELQEYRDTPGHYKNLQLPKPLLDSIWLWLIVPLLQGKSLVGMVLLAEPKIKHEMNWEVRDLIKVAAHHVASYLQLEETLRALNEAKQFEGFNRLSAYVIHDLKNLIAQLSLVVSNAHRHRDNPEFLEDVVATVENSVGRMNRLLEQLRAGAVPRPCETVNLAQIAREAVEACADRMPRPELKGSEKVLMVDADRERLLSVIRHLILNAQEATPPDGFVRLRIGEEGETGYLEIADNGCGMDAEFVRDRLFRPFDSTKGLTGMGIGAFEGRELFRSMGGDIEVESVPGMGTRLRCLVPMDAARPDG